MVKTGLNNFVVGQKQVCGDKDIDAYPNMNYSIKNFSVFAGH